MTAEIYKVAMPGHFFVFVATQDAGRRAIFERVLRDLGVPAGPHSFFLKRDRASPQSVRDALGEMEADDCVYVIGAANEKLENYVIVAPRTEGGIKVSSAG